MATAETSYASPSLSGCRNLHGVTPQSPWLRSTIRRIRAGSLRMDSLVLNRDVAADA
jgi:hypothetical protein